jgi:hypothetical protein
MVRRKAETFEPVTMGHIRGHGCRADVRPDWSPHVSKRRV